MMAGDGSIAVDEIIGHEVDIVDKGGNIFPVDGCLEIFGKAAGRETDFFFLAKFFAEQADELGEMVLVFGVEGIAGYVDQGGIFPVQVDSVGVEVVRELYHGADEFGSPFFGGENVGAGLTTAPAAEGEDDLEFGMSLFEGDQLLDRGGISGVADVELVAFEVAEAEDNMGEFPGREAVDGGAPSGVVTDDGEEMLLSACGGGGQSGNEEQKEQARVHNHPFVSEKYPKRVVCNAGWGTNFGGAVNRCRCR